MLDLCCCGFLSAVRVIRVAQYPVADSGAEIENLVESIGADAAIVAVLTAQLGLSAGFVTNPVGKYGQGRQLLELLERKGVQSTARSDASASTPQSLIVTDHSAGLWPQPNGKASLVG